MCVCAYAISVVWEIIASHSLATDVLHMLWLHSGALDLALLWILLALMKERERERMVLNKPKTGSSNHSKWQQCHWHDKECFYIIFRRFVNADEAFLFFTLGNVTALP